jgi:glutamate---cysteine ligase / carboxylate-amine ligase
VTVGVEEEFLLVDPDTGQPVDLATPVLATARSWPPVAPDALVHTELLGSQVEAATGICVTLTELTRQLQEGRTRLAKAADAHGALLISSGTSVLPGAIPPSAGERFDWIARTYRGLVTDYHSCGCHVHVGVPDRDLAVAVLNHLAPWLPTMLALSVNSPYDRGVDTGYASWRMVTQSRFPGSGIAPWFASAAAYDDQVGQLVDCGVLVDRHQSFWLARLSPRLPTIEFRVADAAGTVADAVLQAALSRALVRTALIELGAGREARPVNAQLAAAAVWSAARYGLRGPAIDLRTGRTPPATQLVDDLISLVTPALEDFGDLTSVRAAVKTVYATGTGAEHQRRAGPLGVVHLLAERTLANLIGES